MDNLTPPPSDADTPLLPHPPRRHTNGPQYRNVAILGALCVLVFLGGSQNLQSSVNEKHGVGDIALAVTYIMLTISSVVAPSIIDRLGVKLALILGMLTYGVFAVCNIFGQYYTIIPGAALMGFGATILWTAQGVFIAESAHGYQQYLPEQDRTYSRAVNALSGLFFGIFQINLVVINQVAYGVFRLTDRDHHDSQDVRALNQVSNATQLLARHHDGDDDNLYEARIILFTVFATLSLSGTMLTICFVKDPVTTDWEDGESLPLALADDNLLEEEFQNPFADDASVDDDHVNPVVKGVQLLMHSRRLQLLVPMFVYSGMEAAFINGDFPEYVVKRMNDKETDVPLVMTFFGLSNMLGSYLGGRFVTTRAMGTIAMVVAGALHIGVMLYVLIIGEKFDDFKHYKESIVIVCAIVWGIGDAFYNTFITALLGSSFESQHVTSAFSQFKMWQSLSTAVVFFYSPALSTVFGMDIKTILTMSVCVVATVAMLLSECGVCGVQHHRVEDAGLVDGGEDNGNDDDESGP